MENVNRVSHSCPVKVGYFLGNADLSAHLDMSQQERFGFNNS